MQNVDSPPEPVALTENEEAPKGLWRETFENLIRNPSAVAGMIILGALLLIAVFAPFIATHDPERALFDIPEEGPSRRMKPCIHLLGCPEAGDEVFGISFDAPITAVAYNKTRSALLVATGNEVQVWDAAEQEMRYSLSHDQTVTYAAWSPNDQRILVASGTQLFVWDINRREVILTLEQEGKVEFVAWASDGGRFVSAGERDIHFWLDCTNSLVGYCSSVSTAEVKWVDVVYELDEDWVSIQWSGGGEYVMVAAGDTVRLLEPPVAVRPVMSTIEEKAVVIEHEEPVNSAQFDSQGSYILTASGEQVFIWDWSAPESFGETGTFELIQSFTYDEPVLRAGWSEQIKDDRVWIVANSADTLIVWDVDAPGEPLYELTHDDGVLIGSASSPRATRLVSFSERSVRVWDAETRDEIFSRSLSEPIQTVVWQLNGDGIQVAGETILKTFKTWNFQYIMGTDGNNRDEFSRLIYGTRVSLRVGFTSVTFAIVIGTMAGAISGFLGGWADNIIMRVMDVMLAFPSLILAIAVVTILGPGLNNALLAISVVFIPHYARVARSGALTVKEQDYVMADRALGVSPARILFRRILPNILAPLIVQATLGIGTAILDAAALSFLGLGAQPPTAEWGFMLSEERNQLLTAPHLVFFPGVAIMITVLAFNLLGDGLRDALDPRLNR